MLYLVNDTIDLHKISMNRFDLKQKVLNLDRLCTKSLSIFQLAAKQKGLTFSYHISPELLPMNLTSDEDRIIQILVNFLSNSIKYT